MNKVFVLLLCACAARKPPPQLALPEETHLRDLRRLTQGGENAEAYWSFDGRKLTLQSRGAKEQCDRIYHLDLASGDVVQVSSGKGATTCSYFLPGDEESIYASTHLGGDACPPRPDMSQGYVWAIYKDYDIFKRSASGELIRLTETPGYDAEGTVCAKDGSIIFTSVRDGDLELYRMDKDGANVRRLTNEPGYDGGAFFNADCTKIVWRASRPKGAELDEYRKLLAQGLVKPTQLEIWTANADGSDARQVTYLGAASFAPSFFPDGKRIIFSSNYGDEAGREFDLWAVNVDGTNLERITHAPGFDGFPMFSPDGQWLAFSSNRAFPKGSHETDVYVAHWAAGGEVIRDRSPDRMMRDIRALAAPEFGGRGIGTPGLEQAGAYVEQRMKEIGLNPFRQEFDVPVAVKVEGAVSIDGKPAEFAAPGYAASGDVEGALVLAGYGLADDYASLDVKGKIALARRFVPDLPAFATTDAQRRFGDLRYKAWTAREHGAKALIVVDWPEGQTELPSEAALPAAMAESSDAGIPVVIVKRAVFGSLTAAKSAHLQLKLTIEKKPAFNVVARLGASGPERVPGALIIGAHYDHLGLGGRYSLAPDKHEPHLGADDNASGVAGLLEAARILKDSGVKRDVIFAAFSGEESGLLGSSFLAKSPMMSGVAAMLNMDMIGRLRGNRVNVLGADSAEEWGALAASACADARLECTTGGDGYGPSDQTPFYAAGIPVLFFFTGAHGDYHKPSDTPDKINAAGAAQIASLAAEIAAATPARLTYRKVPAPAPQGDLRSFGASLGTIPDYAGPPNGQKGMLISGVRPGGAADRAGMQRGDILVQLGKHRIDSVEDLMYALNASKPGETVQATVLRDGKEVKLEATFQESKRAR